MGSIIFGTVKYNVHIAWVWAPSDLENTGSKFSGAYNYDLIK